MVSILFSFCIAEIHSLQFSLGKDQQQKTFKFIAELKLDFQSLNVVYIEAMKIVAQSNII